MANLFIIGFQKCGSSALADYLVTHQLAHYLVDRVKEPYIYAHSKPQPKSYEKLFYLDANVGYIKNQNAINNLPEHNTKIIVCLRNQFERAWSCYKGYKLFADEKQSYRYLKSFPTITEATANDPKKLLFDILRLHYPLKSSEFVKNYLQIEWERINSQSFLERISYEISFHLTRNQFPFLSILENSFYSSSLKYLLQKFTCDEVTILDLKIIKQDEQRREKFIATIFNVIQKLPDIPEMFSGSCFSIKEDVPNFLDPKFDLLRKIFSNDIAELIIVLQKNNMSDAFIDWLTLGQYLER